MTIVHPIRLYPGVFAVLFLLASCSQDEPSEAPGTAEEKITNRLAVPPEVVANLGITFEKATQGKVGVWVTVPGELYVPTTHRWSLRAPAHGRLKAVVAAWTPVEAGAVVAELVSPELRQAQQTVLAAYSRREHAKEEFEASQARLAESEAQLLGARKLQTASQKRMEHLRELRKNENAFTSKEFLESQRASSAASKAALESAVRRDELREVAREKNLFQAQAQLRVDQTLSAFSVLTGRTVKELLEKKDGVEVWKTLELIVMRAPARGIIVEVPVSRDETVDKGDLVALILDPIELRFRGWVPEGDLRSLRSGAPVKIELPGGIEPVTSKLLGPMPVADSLTRRLQVEAIVPNPERMLPQGLSATAYVQIQESAHQEVLIPEDCVVLDGLDAIVFRQDPKDSNFVIRTPVELGLRGAGRIEILSAVGVGDSVVRKGIYQLKQTGLGKAPSGVHFHADGTWHAKHK